MPQKQGSSSADAGRLDGSLGTAAVAGDFALGVGWGDAATKAVLAGSTDQRGKLTVTSGGTGQAQATATVAHTFADGAYAAAPFAILTVTSTSAIDEGHVTWSSTTTVCTWTFSVLPVDTKVYTFTYAYIA